MRRIGAAVAGLLVLASCAPTGHLAHGRQGSWHKVTVPELTAGPSRGIAALVPPGEGYPRWTAVGSVRVDGAASAAAWSSADGQRWDRVELAAEATAAGVAVRQGVAVAAGAVLGPSGDQDAALWRSVDGSAWAAVDLRPSGAAGPGRQAVTTVAAGPLGFLAAGVDRGIPAVWRSTDGTAWIRVDGPFLDEHAIGGVAVGRAGMVAVGTIRTGGDVDGMAWFSADGSAWRAVPLGTAGFTGPDEQAVRAVTATAAGFVAVGHDDHASRRAGVVWASADGITWQRLPPAPGMTPSVGEGATDGTSVRAVGGTGPVVAVGHNGSEFLV